MSGAFACETARSRRAEIRGLELHLLEWGPAVRSGILLLHGGAAHAHWFDAVAVALAERRHVVALDQRGHGDSAWARPPAYATEDFAGDIVGVIDGLGWESAVLVGHSMGGHNAIACAAWQPDRIRGLVIVDSRPAIPAERLARMKERGERPPRRHPTIEAVVAAFRLLPPETNGDPSPARPPGARERRVAGRRRQPAVRPGVLRGARAGRRLAAPAANHRAHARGPGRAEPDSPASHGGAPSRRAARRPARRDTGRAPPSGARPARRVRPRAPGLPGRPRRLRDGRRGVRITPAGGLVTEPRP